MTALQQLWHLANSAHCFCGCKRDICYKHDGDGAKCAMCKHEEGCHPEGSPVAPQATTATIRGWMWAVTVLVALTSLYFGAQLL